MQHAHQPYAEDTDQLTRVTAGADCVRNLYVLMNASTALAFALTFSRVIVPSRQQSGWLICC